MRPEHASSARRVATRLRRLSVEEGSAQRPGLFLFIAFLLPASWLPMTKQRGIEADARAGHSLGLPALGSSAWWTVAVPSVTKHWLTHRSSLYRPDTGSRTRREFDFPSPQAPGARSTGVPGTSPLFSTWSSDTAPVSGVVPSRCCAGPYGPVIADR